jgi:hypothetical protein
VKPLRAAESTNALTGLPSTSTAKIKKFSSVLVLIDVQIKVNDSTSIKIGIEIWIQGLKGPARVDHEKDEFWRVRFLR